VAGIGQAGTAGQAEGSVGFSDSPTITFIPQSDSGFYKSLYSAFDVTEVIGFALAYRYVRSHPDWQTLSMWFSFGSINDASDFVGGRASDLYRQRIQAMARLLELGAYFRQIPEWDFDVSTLPKEKVTAEDQVTAFKEGLFFVEEDEGKRVRLAKYRMVLALSLPAPDDPKVIEALEQLGVEPGRKRYILRPPTHAIPGALDPHAIWVTPRSMSDVINLATRFVEVPSAHAGLVPPLEKLEIDSPVISSLRIRSSRKEPPFPYRVLHRGYWFYVDDSEVQSKVFLEAMVTTYSSRVGSYQAGDSTQPQVVLPVGG
jgi:hypothetical protein